MYAVSYWSPDNKIELETYSVITVTYYMRWPNTSALYKFPSHHKLKNGNEIYVEYEISGEK